MRAIVHEHYGAPSVLELREVPEPEATGDRILIRVRAASVNRSDWETLTARPAVVRLSGSGFWRPRRPILGSDMAGVIEAVGPAVTEFEPGDEVLGDIIWHGLGAFAEYVSVPATAPLVRKPPEISFEQAAALPQAAGLALQGLRSKRETQSGDRVLIVGAGGGGGSFAVQLAAAVGAEVTGVDSRAKLEFIQSIGADHVIDYTADDYTKRGERFDRILDFVGSHSILANQRVLSPGGVYSMVGGSIPRLLGAVLGGWLLSRTHRQMGLLISHPSADDLSDVVSLVVEGTMRPMIDKTYPLNEVPAALSYLGSGHAKGKLVIAI